MFAENFTNPALKRRSTSSSEHEVSVGKQLKLDDEVEIYF